MKIILLLILSLSFSSNLLHAQLGDIVKGILQDNAPINTDTLKKADTSNVVKIRQELEASRLNESNLKMELEQLKLQALRADSVKATKQRSRIDSLRKFTVGAPVVVDGDTLFHIYTKNGGYTPQQRAQINSETITELGRRVNLNPDSVHVVSSDIETDLIYGDVVIVSFTDQDGLWAGSTRDDLAQKEREVIVDKLKSMKQQHGLWALIRRIVYFILILAGQYLLFRLTRWLFRRVKTYIHSLKESRLKSISIKEYELFDTQLQVRILVFFANVIRYILLLILLLITVPLLFAIFPQTKYLAYKIFSYILDPAVLILKEVIDYIPNLFTILIIYFAIKYMMKGVAYLAREIESEKLKISGFYPDWAKPTYHIIRFLLYAFMIAMIYPYLPGSDKGVFQGVSVFVGLIVSLGSSAVIGNVIAGLIITYMRPFKIGDRIKLNETMGNVIEKTPFVTRLKTPKNEIVTIPNSFVMSSHTVNYSSSARNYGLIIHSEVTIGYDAPWRTVHELLINAALDTPGVSAEPKPFVLETSLKDWYPVYQVNAYIKDADKLAEIYSNLHQNIQDHFNRAGVEIMSPTFIATRDGNESTIPKPQTPPVAK